MEWITCGIQSIQGALREKYPIFFGFCRKLARTKTPKSTDKVRKHNWCTVFYTLFLCASIGSVKFVFYPLLSCNVTYSLSLTTSLLSSFHWEGYLCHPRNRNCVSVTPGGTPSPPPPLISHPILWSKATSFFMVPSREAVTEPLFGC